MRSPSMQYLEMPDQGWRCQLSWQDHLMISSESRSVSTVWLWCCFHIGFWLCILLLKLPIVQSWLLVLLAIQKIPSVLSVHCFPADVISLSPVAAACMTPINHWNTWEKILPALNTDGLLSHHYSRDDNTLQHCLLKIHLMEGIVSNLRWFKARRRMCGGSVEMLYHFT